MASERDQAVSQAQAIEAAERAARDRGAVPLWYWLILGLGIGLAIFALVLGNVVLSVISVLVIGLGSRALTASLARARGIRVFGIIGAAGWLAVPFVAVVGGIALLSFHFIQNNEIAWAGASAFLLSLAATCAFGLGFDRLRRHPAEAGR